MSAFYLRRGEKTIGPYTAEQVAKGKAQNSFLDSDLIAETASGPWAPLGPQIA
jgi:hypothetical protein